MKKTRLIGFACCLLLFAGVCLDCSAILAQPDAESAPEDNLPEGGLVRLGSARLRHRSSVNQVAYSPNGRLVAARCVNNDVGVHLWNAQDGRHVRHLNSTSRRGWVEDFAFSPDGQTLVATWLDKGLTLWEVSTGRLRWEFAGDEAKAKSVAFAPNNPLIAVGAPDGSVVLRKANSGALIRQIAQRPKKISSTMGFAGGLPQEPFGETVLAFSPDGSQLARGVKSPPLITVVDVATGKVISEIEQAHGTTTGRSNPALQWLTITRDGKRIVSAGHRSVPRENLERKYGSKNVNIAEIRVWDIQTGRKIQDLSGERVGESRGYAALARDGRTLAIATTGSLRLWNLEREELIRDIYVLDRGVHPPAFSPDGSRIIAGVGSSVAMWDVASGARLLNGGATHDGPVSAVAYSPKGRIVATEGGGTIRVWDDKSGRQRFVRRFGRDAFVYELEFSPDGRLLLAAGNRFDVESPGGVVRLWDVDTGDLVREIRTGEEGRWGGGAQAIAVSADSKRLAIAETHSNNRKIQLWDMSAGRKLATYPPGDEFVWQVSDLHFSPDGRYVWTVCGNSHVYRWDTQGNDHFNFIADWRPSKERDPKREPSISQATFTSDARTLVTLPENKVLHFWDTDTGKLRFTMELPGVKKGARFGLSPDGSTIAVTDKYYMREPDEDDITVWHIPSQTRRLTLKPNDARAWSFAFSSDGKQLLTGFDRGTSMIWKLGSSGE